MPQSDPFQIALNALRDALLKGEFDRLDSLLPAIAEGVTAAHSRAPDPTILHSARELSVLLIAAGRGFTAAREKLREYETIRHGGGTYDVNGERQRLNIPAAESRKL